MARITMAHSIDARTYIAKPYGAGNTPRVLGSCLDQMPLAGLCMKRNSALGLAVHLQCTRASPLIGSNTSCWRSLSFSDMR